MEAASIVRGQTFGTYNPELAGMTVVTERSVPLPEKAVWVLEGVRYLSSDGSAVYSDADGQFEITRIEPLIWVLVGMDRVSTTFSAPGYRELEVAGRHGQVLRVVLLRGSEQN
jgi:hypothetical protein